MIDLSRYILTQSEFSICPDCNRRVFLLMQRDMEGRKLPTYYLCLCGSIRCAGQHGSPALTEIAGSLDT